MASKRGDVTTIDDNGLRHYGQDFEVEEIQEAQDVNDVEIYDVVEDTEDGNSSDAGQTSQTSGGTVNRLACDLCGYFSDKTNSNMFMRKIDHLIRTHFLDKVTEAYPVNPPVCPEEGCDVKFKNKQDFYRHWCRQHGYLERWLKEEMLKKGLTHEPLLNGRVARKKGVRRTHLTTDEVGQLPQMSFYKKMTDDELSKYLDDEVEKAFIKVEVPPDTNLPANQLFTCPHCKKSYLKRMHLVLHNRHYHWSKLSPASLAALREKFRCPDCGLRFNASRFLTRHQRLVHNKSFPFRCDICKKGFAKKPMYQEHLEKDHPPEVVLVPANEVEADPRE